MDSTNHAQAADACGKDNASIANHVASEQDDLTSTVEAPTTPLADPHEAVVEKSNEDSEYGNTHALLVSSVLLHLALHALLEHSALCFFLTSVPRLGTQARPQAPRSPRRTQPQERPSRRKIVLKKIQRCKISTLSSIRASRSTDKGS